MWTWVLRCQAFCDVIFLVCGFSTDGSGVAHLDTLPNRAWLSRGAKTFRIKNPSTPCTAVMSTLNASTVFAGSDWQTS